MFDSAVGVRDVQNGRQRWGHAEPLRGNNPALKQWWKTLWVWVSGCFFPNMLQVSL